MLDPSQYRVPDQGGKVAVVTGANGGLGLCVAERLAAAGADVVMACRNMKKAADAARRVEAASTGGRVSVLALDLSSQSSVREAASKATAELGRVDMLVNNAGVMAVPRELTEDGWERQLATNHLGHFAFTALLWPLLAEAPAARVVAVSSNAHRMGRIRFDDLDGERSYNPWVAYAQSKLADLLFVAELQRRLDAVGSPAMATAAHPGWSATDLQTTGRGAGRLETRLMDFVNGLFGQSAAMGALPTVHAATSPNVVAGGYYGPGGPLEMRGFPVPVGRSRAAADAATAHALWEVSELRTGVEFTAG
ncbi:MAG: SDR family NAD(P)-dependent oxidoreductase [Actinomycetia bacterium]|nr:SDR family NAD(P)-dependent oxidoreductase [Actinomycetes bacterium]